VNAPLFATFLLGMFWKRTTGHGAFAGLLAGIGTAVAHHGLTLVAGGHPGVHGGWIAVLHRYPSDLAQSAWTAIFAFAVNLIVTAGVSLFTRAREGEELAGLVYSLLPARKRVRKSFWKRPETLAAVILIAAIALNLFLA
jgi:SSS family solute:Na+ symporter